ncbi:head decoration protein [Labrenzia sp. DG1229]|uniref:head decoration protein n=1 Tax=Labrenzia sp. DG1229 TaxID=681847 RepID=UPI000690D29F|nr:head decoration protein [Labrenzia sp. DG1229]
MTVLTKGPVAGECIISEGAHGFSRDTGSVVVPADETFLPNTVLGQVTANDTFVKYDPANSDGSETPAAILIYRADTGTADKALLVRHAQVRAADLVFFDGATPAQMQTAYGELKTLGIIVR